VTTLAGLAGISGSADGAISAARFDLPSGITTDGTNLYVADSYNNTIRKIVITTGTVTTLAGLAGTSGSADGVVSIARFYQPEGITTDGTNLYVADSGNHTIREIVIATGSVTTIAGLAGISGSAIFSSLGSAARFNNPTSITTDGMNLYVADYNNNTIRMFTGCGAAPGGYIEGRITPAHSGIVITTNGGGNAISNPNGAFFMPHQGGQFMLTVHTNPSCSLPVMVATNGKTDVLINLFLCLGIGADATPPTVTEVTASSPTNSLSIPVMIAADDLSGVASYLVTTSSTLPVSTASDWRMENPYIYTVTTDGTYTLYGWAKDTAENVSSQYNPITVTVDTTTPIITGTNPAANATGVAAENVISITFSEAMNASTINSSTFTVKSGTMAVAGTVRYNAITKTATFTPLSHLLPNTSYTAMLTTDVKDVVGNPLGSIFTWDFATSSTSIPGDLDGDGAVTVADAIIALQVMAGRQPPALRSDYTTSNVDVTGDGRVGPPEALYILQKAAGAR
jgi:hypothetical protein